MSEIHVEATPFACNAKIEDVLESVPADYIQELKRQAQEGNVWAWCDIEVRAWSDELPGIRGEVWSDHCSFDDRFDFERSESYIELRRAAIHALRDNLLSQLNAVSRALGDVKE